MLERALRRRRPGPYQVQAAIAACHAGAGDAADTDWPQIAVLYGQLARMTPSPVVELNRAVAVAMADGPAAGLALVDALDASGALAGYHLLPATQADLLRRLGRADEAAAAYRRALELTAGDAERDYLRRRLAEVTRLTSRVHRVVVKSAIPGRITTLGARGPFSGTRRQLSHTISTTKKLTPISSSNHNYSTKSHKPHISKSKTISSTTKPKIHQSH